MPVLSWGLCLLLIIGVQSKILNVGSEEGLRGGLCIPRGLVQLNVPCLSEQQNVDTVGGSVGRSLHLIELRNPPLERLHIAYV